MKTTSKMTKVAIVGGGLAGLTTAVYLARAGYRVTVLEKARAVGGRAQTQTVAGFQFNLGPHALYAAGEATAVLRDLDISFSGGKPTVHQTRFAVAGRLTRLPLALRDVARLPSAIARIMRTDPASVATVPLGHWLAETAPSARLRALLATLGRVATYAHDSNLSTAVYLQQMQRSLRQGVVYLDGGWQGLVAGLRRAAEDAGAEIRVGTRTTAVAEHEDGVIVQLASGEVLAADAVVVAVGLRAAAALLPHHEAVRTAAETAVPVRAALLDVALTRLPKLSHSLVLGLDAPIYLSVHSQAARLAPSAGSLIHVVRYLAPGETGADARPELEALLDLAQSGWREVIAHVRFLPEMTVVSRLAAAAEGGMNGRVHPQLSRRLFLAGDWVGEAGWLADASLASAREAARLIGAQLPAIEQSYPTLAVVD